MVFSIGGKLKCSSCISKLSDKDAHNEELMREIANLKRKVARTSGEMADMKLLLEKSQSRNAELEKKQRRLVHT